MRIYIAKSRLDKSLSGIDILWENLAEILCKPVRTSETLAEYRQLDRQKQCEIKDVGGFIGGELQNGKRAIDSLVSRCLITLDLDVCDNTIFAKLDNFLSSYDAVVYSTHKHTPEKPRLRIVMPLKENISPEEYVALARMIASKIDINAFDDTTYEPSRLMFFPSVAKDGVFFSKKYAGTTLDGKNSLLAWYQDWKDTSAWPISDTQKKRGVVPFFKTGKGSKKDPREKPGLVGYWCKSYTIEEVIEIFLPDIYSPCGAGRYSYTQSETAGGLVVFDHLFAYSHHATDPINGKTVNAFDLLRIHKFGSLDENVKPNTKPQNYPSYVRALEYVACDSRVKAEILKTTAFDGTDVSAVAEKLILDGNGIPVETLENYVHILNTDPNLLNIAFDGLLQGIVVIGKVPWERKTATGIRWTPIDNSYLRAYLSRHYHLQNEKNIADALNIAAANRYYHPIKDYFDGLSWDGVRRLDTLFIDYLGANDDTYTRMVTRKTLCAAVKRIYEPGCKFDNMLVLNGAQGLGKSTLFAKLAGDWFSDSLRMNDMRSKDAPEKLQGKLIVEIPELAGMSKAEEDDIKSFLSRRIDSYRAAYGHSVLDYPRQCIVVGTTNSKNGFLKDDTGNRRFWPVKVDATKTNKTVWSLTKEEIDSIWAEAVWWTKQGESLYLSLEDEQVAREKQREQLATDDREGLVRDYLEILLPDNWEQLTSHERQHYCYIMPARERKGEMRRMEVSNIEIWHECFGRRKDELTARDARAIKLLMEAIGGWSSDGSRKNLTGGYGQQRVYRRVEQGPASEVGDTDGINS